MKKINESKLIIIIFGLGILLSLIPLFVFWYHFPYRFSDSIEDWGNWGQYISGSMGAILSVLTIFLVVKSINLQTKEFNSMIENQKETTKLLLNQNFENTFFRLIELHHKVVESVVGYVNDKQYSGRDFFYHFVLTSRDDIKKEEFERHVNNYSEKFSHYRSTLFETFNFIESNALIDEKNKYFNIFKSQLSNVELITLCYLASKGNDRELFNLLNKYNLFDLVKLEEAKDLPSGVLPLAINEYINKIG